MEEGLPGAKDERREADDAPLRHKAVGWIFADIAGREGKHRFPPLEPAFRVALVPLGHPGNGGQRIGTIGSGPDEGQAERRRRAGPVFLEDREGFSHFTFTKV
jgi:hypothetical protein